MPPVSRAAAAEQNVPPRLAYVGAATCSAVGCHGGSEANPGDASAYRTWLTRDPHARAYTVLENERSQRMAELLAGRGGTPVSPTRDARCLNCHVRPDALGSQHAGTSTLTDGVSCESCHGPAERWLESHWADWPARSPGAEARAASGMIATSDIEARARLCASCHVGGPGRDVNHDLIAAGHPRLAFEFSAYMANLPRHWDVASPASAQPNRVVHEWTVGQLVSARAALELLAWRAGPGPTTVEGKSERGDKDRPWPEFAEYACESCHHHLSRRTESSVSNGSLRWGTWYFAVTPRNVRAGPDGAVGKLAREMGQNDPQRDQVLEQAKLLAIEYTGSLASRREARSLAVSEQWHFIRETVAGFEARGADMDGRAQLYLLVLAFNDALEQREGELPREARLALGELARSLAAARGDEARTGPRSGQLPAGFREAIGRYLNAVRVLVSR